MLGNEIIISRSASKYFHIVKVWLGTNAGDVISKV